MYFHKNKDFQAEKEHLDNTTTQIIQENEAYYHNDIYHDTTSQVDNSLLNRSL
jgi:hypothetical protein